MKISIKTFIKNAVMILGARAADRLAQVDASTARDRVNVQYVRNMVWPR